MGEATVHTGNYRAPTLAPASSAARGLWAPGPRAHLPQLCGKVRKMFSSSRKFLNKTSIKIQPTNPLPHPFQVVSRVFTELYSHSQFQNILITPRRHPVPIHDPSPLPLPSALGIYFLPLRIRIQTFPINGIIQNAVLCVWLSSCGVFSRLLSGVPRVRISLLLPNEILSYTQDLFKHTHVATPPQTDPIRVRGLGTERGSLGAQLVKNRPAMRETWL